MERRIYLTRLATAGATLIAGCSGGGANTVVSGSTNYEETWDVDLKEGDELELEVTLEDGLFSLGSVSRKDNGDGVASIETEEQTTVTEQFTAPETVDYFVVLQVEEGGEASLALRHTDE
jgi:hypothetical protein